MNEIGPDGRVIVAVVFICVLACTIDYLDLIRVAWEGNVYMDGCKLLLITRKRSRSAGVSFLLVL